ncbi:hypothetical protein D3C71_1787650 [compost metagenome]
MLQPRFHRRASTDGTGGYPHSMQVRSSSQRRSLIILRLASWASILLWFHPMSWLQSLLRINTRKAHQLMCSADLSCQRFLGNNDREIPRTPIMKEGSLVAMTRLPSCFYSASWLKAQVVNFAYTAKNNIISPIIR